MTNRKKTPEKYYGTGEMVGKTIDNPQTPDCPHCNGGKREKIYDGQGNSVEVGTIKLPKDNRVVVNPPTTSSKN